MSNPLVPITSIASLVRSIRKDSTYSGLLMGLHTARRLSIMQIDDATREGTSTTSLDRDLGANRMATRHFLAYLKGHA